jgi:peptidoglycan/xylan/chitin deacetylase (PgdA/CDA1 family)
VKRHAFNLSIGSPTDWSNRVLAYHEFALTPSRDVYYLHPAIFEEHVESALEAAKESSTSIVFSFDDAHVSQIELAAPILEKFGVRGLFFVPASWVGIKHQVASWTALGRLLKNGHSIGSHGLTHTYLSGCSPIDLRHELYGSRAVLEDRLGHAVTSISMPGGRWSMDTIEACIVAGYQHVYTSEPTPLETLVSNPQGESLTIRGRLVVRRSMSVKLLADFITRRTFGTKRLEYEYTIKQLLQRALGESAYRSVWRSLLRNPH